MLFCPIDHAVILCGSLAVLCTVLCAAIAYLATRQSKDSTPADL